MSHDTTTEIAVAPRGLTEADVSNYSGFSQSFLRASRLGRGDGPPYVRVGRAVRYLRDDVDRWLEQRRVETRRRA